MTPSQDQVLQRLLKESGEKFHQLFTWERGPNYLRNITCDQKREIEDFLTAAITKAFHAGAEAQREMDAKICEEMVGAALPAPDGYVGGSYDDSVEFGHDSACKGNAAAIRSQAPEKKCCDKCRGSVVIARVGGGDWGRKEKCQSPNCDCHAPEQPTQKPLQEEKKDV